MPFGNLDEFVLDDLDVAAHVVRSVLLVATVTDNAGETKVDAVRILAAGYEPEILAKILAVSFLGVGPYAVRASVFLDAALIQLAVGQSLAWLFAL